MTLYSLSEHMLLIRLSFNYLPTCFAPSCCFQVPFSFNLLVCCFDCVSVGSMRWLNRRPTVSWWTVVAVELNADSWHHSVSSLLLCSHPPGSFVTLAHSFIVVQSLLGRGDKSIGNNRRWLRVLEQLPLCPVMPKETLWSFILLLVAVQQEPAQHRWENLISSSTMWMLCGVLYKVKWKGSVVSVHTV